MKRLTMAIMTTAVFMCAGNAMAAKIITPESLPGGTIVSPEIAKQLHYHAKFYDMRKIINYGKGHVPGATSIPFKPKSKKVVRFDMSKDKLDVAKFPTDKSTPIVFYSDGPYGWKSYKASMIAIKLGYTHVKWMRSGYSSWKQAGYSVE